jgi:class 3 adenylate cyclase
MKLPIASVLSTTIVVSLLGIVAIVAIFVTMHRNSAIDGAVALTHASVQNVQKAVRGPFDATAPQVRAAATSFRSSGSYCRLMNASLLPDAFRNLGAIHTSTTSLFAVYQTYRFPLPNAGAPAGTHSNQDFPWGDCGCADGYCFVSRDLPTPEFPPSTPGLEILPPAPVSTPIVPLDRAPFDSAGYIYTQTIMRLTRAEADAGTWGRPEVYFSGALGRSIPYITFHVPLEFDPVTGFAINAVSADLSLATAAAFLSRLDLPATHVAVLDRSARVVLAQTYPGVPAFNTTNASEPENSVFWTFDDVPSPELREAVALSADNGDNRTVADEFVFVTDDKIVGIGAVQLPGLHLSVLVVSDKAYYLQASVRARNVSIAVGAIVFVLLCAAIVAATAATVRPIARVAQQVRSAAEFGEATEAELKDASQRSVLAEVADLQDSYAALQAELARVRGFVPQAVLLRYDAGDDATGDDDDDNDDTREETTRSHRSSGHNRCRSHSSNNVAHSSTQQTKETKRSATSSAAAAAAAAAALGIGLKDANITVVVGNLQGYSHALKTSSVASAVNGLAAVVDELTASIQRHGGVLTLFHGDHFVVSFNAARACMSHRRKACQLAGEVAKASEGTKLGLLMNFGVTTGTCLVGNLGSNAAKASSVVGTAFTRASMLERLTRVYGCGILTTRAVTSDLTGLFPWLYVDLLRLPTAAAPNATDSRGGRRHRDYVQTLVAAIVPHAKHAAAPAAVMPGADGEWLYTVQADGGNAAWEAHNRRFEKVAALAAKAGHTAGLPVDSPTRTPRKRDDAPAPRISAALDDDQHGAEGDAIPFGAAPRLEELELLAAVEGSVPPDARSEQAGLATYTSAAELAPYGGLV